MIKSGTEANYKMSNELLIVYNTCGVNGDDYTRLDKYVESVESILNQDFEHSINLCVSSCLNSDKVVGNLQDRFFDGIDIYRCHELVPVNVTFNKAIQECVKKYGEFEFYCYIDSGIRLLADNTLQKMYEIGKQDNAMVSVVPSSDSGFEHWSIKYDDNTKVYKIPLGSAINLHCQFFSNKLFKNFDNRVMPDCFKSFCTESVFGALCAAIKSQWVLLTNITVEHIHLDGASAVSNGGRHDEIYLLNKTIYDIFFTEEAKETGIFYEQYRNILPVDLSKYDENGWSRDNKLRDWILKNLFLSRDILNYENIKGEFWHKK